MVSTPLAEHAPAKVNLFLRVAGRRNDGFHDLESLVVFAQVCDRLELVPDGALSLSVTGIYAAAAGPADGNLVIKAARALAGRIGGLRLGRFTLDKQLPAAAGLGGGSADAAAALRLLARANTIALGDARLAAAAAATGADVPVCLDPRPRLMRGKGDELSAVLSLPSLPSVLVNPGVALATKDVFTAFAAALASVRPFRPVSPGEIPLEPEALLTFLGEQFNDLEPAAAAIAPVVGEALAALRALPGCRLARMSGSGATCFGIFDSAVAADAAARELAAEYPKWWIRATRLG